MSLSHESFTLKISVVEFSEYQILVMAMLDVSTLLVDSCPGPMHDRLLQGPARPLMIIAPPMGFTVSVFYAVLHNILTSLLGFNRVLSLMEPHHVPECSETHSEYDHSQSGTQPSRCTSIRSYCCRKGIFPRRVG